jgi:O-antigen/teichoic acid export membrane protein
MTRVRGAALQGLGHVVRGQIPWMLLRPSVFLVLLVVAYVLKFTLGAGAAMGLSALTAAIVLVITHNWMRDRLPPGHATQEISAQRDWLASSLRLGLMDGLRGLQSELSIILTGLVSGPQAVGFLRIATVTATTSAAAVLVVTYVALPLLARLRSEGDHEKLQKAVSALAWAQFAGVAALALPLMVIPGPLLSLAFGPAFVPAANALRIIAAAYLITAALGPNGPLLVVGNYEGSVARAMGAGLALNVITVPILAHFFGAAGTAIALGVSLVWWNLMCWWDAKRLLGVETSIIQWPWRASIPSTED